MGATSIGKNGIGSPLRKVNFQVDKIESLGGWVDRGGWVGRRNFEYLLSM